MATKKPTVRKPEFEFVDGIDQGGLVVDRLYDETPQGGATQVKTEPLGFWRGAADVGLALGQGATGAFKAVSDVFGAENPVSGALGGMSEYMQGLKSDQSKAELAVSQERIRQAEESGSTMDQVGAYLNMIWDQPAEMLAQGAGSFATLGIGKIAQAAKLAQAAKAAGMTKQAFLATEAGKQAAQAAIEAGFKTNIGVGVAQGLGAVKGSQYEQTYQNAIKQGIPPEQAAALADEAQRYGGQGTMQQLMGAGLGGLASATGPIERMVAGKAAQPSASMLRATGKGFLVEGGTEGLQGAQERYAGNTAAIDAGVLDQSRRWTGVAGQFAQEGVLGGVLGGASGAMEGRAPDAETPAPAPAPIVPESGPLTRAANAGAPVAAKMQAEDAANQALARMAALADEEGAASAIDAPGSPSDAYLATPKPTPEQAAAAEQALEAELAQNEIARTSRPRPVQSAQDQEQTALANVAKLQSMPLEDAQRIYAESAKQGKDMALVQHPDGDYTVAPRRWVTQDMAKQGQQQARKDEIEAAPVERAPRRRTDAVELDPVELAIGAIEKEATPAARAFVQEYRAGRVSADDVMARGKPADPVAALGNIKPATEPGGLILTASGLPFKNKRAATLARDRQENPADFEVKPVEGGFVVQPATPATEASANVAEQQPGNDAGSGVADGAAVSGNLGVVQQPDAAGVDAARTAGGADAGQPAGESGRGSGDDALSARWDALPEADRTPVLLAAGWHQGSAATQRMGKIKWAKMSDSQRARVGQALEASNAAAPQSTPEAQAGQAAEARGTEPAAEAGARVSGARGAEVEADGVTGKKIDDEWTAFARESGTKAIPRAQMPQIKAEHRGAMVQFLKGRGIEHEQDAEVDPQSLKPTQAEFSPAKVEQAKGYEGGDRSILVSADGHVLDGHHQWMAKRQAGAPVKVIRLNAPIDQLIEAVKEFPSADVADGATEVQVPAEDGAESGADRQAPDAAPKASQSVEVDKPAKIEDFGEKLVGARKDYATLLRDAGDVDVSAEPLSKSWPEPDYQKLLDDGADPFVVAFIRAARDELPVKPKTSWKLRGWVDQAEMLRSMAQKLLSGDVSPERVRELLDEPKFRNLRDQVGGRADLYQAAGHDKSLKGMTLVEHFYTLYKGNPNVNLWVVEQKAKATAFSNWPREIATGDTKEEALAGFKAKLGELDTGDKKKSASFVIYSKRGQPGVFIGKKIGREHIDLHKAADVKEAREYLAKNTDKLEEALARYKQTPYERKEDNAPRVGDDHRNGAPVTPDVFADTFGFRGVQFGNYVEQGRRQSDLNEAFDALMDMAAVLDIPPRALSLNGRLGLAFGARGKGGKNAPAAHFEPGNVVINLTKGGGPGSLAHEWWHALDNYFARESGGGYVTGGAAMDKLRAEMQRAFASVKRATMNSGMLARSRELDKRRSTPYWSTPIEMSARSFEAFIIAKLQDQNASNDYLANIVSEKSWEVMDSLRLRPETVPTYPYPTQAEMESIRASFDEFFRVVETRKDEAGNVAMFSRRRNDEVKEKAPAGQSGKQAKPDSLQPFAGAAPEADAGQSVEAKGKGGQEPSLSRPKRAPAGVALRDAQAAADLIRRELPNAPEIVVVDSLADVPSELQNEIRNRAAEFDWEAVYHTDRKIYVMAPHFDSLDRFMFVVGRHEVRHAGLDAMLGERKDEVMLSIGRANRRVMMEARKLMADGLAGSFTEGVEEALADMPVEEVAALSRIKILTAAIRRWLRATAYKLRKAGWNRLADSIEPRKWTDNDVIAFVLKAENVSRAPVGKAGAAQFSRADGAAGEFEQTAIAVGGERAYASAVKSGSTELSYRQWVQVRTPSFKKWWGYDWEQSGVRGAAQGVSESAGRRGAAGMDGEAAQGLPFLHERTKEPRVFFHGTRDAFTAFELSHPNKKDHGWLGVGHYVTSDPWIAETYSRMKRGSGAPRVMELFVRPNNPVVLSPRKKEVLARARPADVAIITDEWIEKGHGGSVLTYENDSIEVAVFDARGIKSAVENRGTFDPENPDIRFSRARTILNDEGRPEFVYGDTKLAFPIPTERLEVIPSPGQSVMQYAIMPTEGFDVLGHVDLLLENGRPVSLLDIEAYSRRKGAGRQVIETLLRAFPDSDLNISNIVPEAQGFWEKMGVPVQNLEEGAAYDGTLNLETFLQAQDGGRAKANPRRAGEAYRRPDAGAARRASEANQGWQVASRFSRPRALQTLRDAGARQAEAVRDASLFAGYKVGDFIESTGKLSWWDKSIGTPFNLAKRHPGTFGRVFNAVQDFLSDVSFYATESANLAPRLLPKLETLKDLTKQAISPEDNKAIAAPIFEGTLTWTRDRAGKPVTMEQAEAAAEKLSAEEKAQELLKSNLLDPKVLRMWQGLPQEQYEAAVSSRYANQLLRPGVVWTDAELRSKFSLTDAQIELYKEFRASVDRSLDDLTVSEIARLVRSDLPGARQKEGQSADDFAMEVRDALFEIGEDKTADKVVLMASRLRDLKAKGYAPLSRFGHFTLDVVDADGERAYFGMFESQAEANRMARKMAQQFPGATITQGTQSTEAYKMLAGVSPETIELFGEILGLDMAGDSASDQAFQEYLKKAKSTRSAMKRLIHRKGIAGFSEEVGRVLAGFVTSNARRTSSNHHLKGIMGAVEAMPKEQGELKDYAAKMAEYVNNPVEEAQALRGLMFAQYLGGSVASALVNMTQPIAVTLPFLSQHTTAAKAAKAVTQAMADMAGRKKLESGLAEAMKLAEDKGIVAPQEIHYLQAQARGAGALVSGDGTRAGDVVARTQNGLSKLAVAWGKLFGFAELVNRRATFIAAYRVAVDKGVKDPFKFAADAVEETQFVYNKGNRPQWARGAIGATLFTFKTYSISYIELLSRMWKQGGPEGKKAFALALAVMVLMSGVDELPFMEDAEDLVDGFAQKVLGLNWQTKTQRQEFMANVLGKDLADFLGKGISGVPGVPIDVSGRLGMGNLIPGTGLLRGDSQSMGRDVAEIAGPVADLIKRGGSAVGMAAQGDIGKAVLEASPVAVRNVAKAVDMGGMDMYRDATGKKVVDTTMGEAVLKGIGFQPNTVAKVQEASLTKQRMIALNKSVESEIADQWALGRFENDPAKVEAARNRLKAWNRDNPDSPIRIEANQIQKRVKAMRASKQERIEKTAPKELRAAVRRELVE